MQKFFMIYRDGCSEGNRAPVKKHDNINAANDEAVRLASKHPGEKFYVLESVFCMSGNVCVTAEACNHDTTR